MKIKDINLSESTTSGSVATVASPLGKTQSRSASIYGDKKGGNLLTGKKTNQKYANSKVSESQARPVSEAHLEEDDLILVPGQGHRLKSGFIPHKDDRRDHEVEMAKSDLFQAAKNAKQVYELIHDITEDEGLEGWVQEKIIKANDYLNTIREYLEGKQLQNEMNGGVIAGGAGNFEEAAGQKYEMRFKNGKTQRFVAATPEEAKNKAKGLGATSLIKVSKDGMPQGKVLEGEKPGLWANIHTKRERIKHGSGERMRKPGSKGAPSAQDFKDAANEGAMTTKPVRGEKPWSPPRTVPKKKYPAIGTVAWESLPKSTKIELLKKRGRDPNEYFGTTGLEEAQSMGTALKNSLAKAEPGSKLDNSIKAHNRHIKAGLPGTLKNAPTGYHFDSKGYCRLGDK